MERLAAVAGAGVFVLWPHRLIDTLLSEAGSFTTAANHLSRRARRAEKAVNSNQADHRTDVALGNRAAACVQRLLGAAPLPTLGRCGQPARDRYPLCQRFES